MSVKSFWVNVAECNVVPTSNFLLLFVGLLETCCDASRLIPSFNTKLPLTPQADACRTARHALRLIATARPAAFITTMAREVARYNALQQNAQTISVPLTQLVLYRAKKEILHCVEMLIDKMQTEMANLLVEVSGYGIHTLCAYMNLNFRFFL